LLPLLVAVAVAVLLLCCADVAAVLPLPLTLLLWCCCCAFSQLNACAHLGSLRKRVRLRLAPFALFLSKNLDGY